MEILIGALLVTTLVLLVMVAGLIWCYPDADKQERNIEEILKKLRKMDKRLK